MATSVTTVPAGSQLAGPVPLGLPSASSMEVTGSSGTVGQPSASYASTAGTSVSITGLEPGRSYRVQVRAYDAAGNASAWSTEITVTTPNGPSPATVAATSTVPAPAAIGTIRPATVAATATISAPAAGFQRTQTPTGTSATFTGLIPGATYQARVRARDAAGNWSAFSTPIQFTTVLGPVPATIAAVASIPAAAIGGAPPTLVTVGRPVVRGGTVGLDVAVTPSGGSTVTSYSWQIISGGGSLTNAGTATPTYTAPGSGSGLVTTRVTVLTSNGGSATADLTVSYHGTIVAAENALTGTARATWDLSSPNLGGVATLQGFADGFTYNRDQTVNFKIGQSDGAGWTAEVYRLGYYGGNGARSYGTLTPSGGQLTTSQSQPAPGDADAVTTLLSADAGNWSTSLTWTPPAWAPTGVYILRLNRTGGGASHIMFILRDDARHADIMFMPSDSTWNAYNAWGGLGANMYSGNSLYLGTAVNQYDADCARFVSYNRPVVNRGAADSGRSYGAVEWSTFFTAEYGMLRFLERNGYDVKYYGCIDAAGDPTGTHLTGGSGRGGAGAGLFVGHNEYWSDGMRAGWETAKAAGLNVFSAAGNEVFWRLVGSSNDAAGRPRVWECYKSTIASRASTGRTEWTGTWRDPDGAGKGGNNPENRFTGTIFVTNGPDLRSLVVPYNGGYSGQPLWRNTSVASLTAGQSYTSGSQILGFEWDTYGPAGVDTTGASFLAAPHQSARYCSNATYAVTGQVLTDAGDVYGDGNVTHRLVVMPSGFNGGITFGTGTVNWAFGLDDTNTYQIGSDNTAVQIQQATVNILADMGAQPASLMGTLSAATLVDWFPEPGTIAAVTVIPGPTVIGQSNATIQPTTVAAVAAIPAPTTRGGATAVPSTVAAVGAVAAPTVRLSVLPAPATVASAAAVPAPQTSGASTVAASTVAAVAAVGTTTRTSQATAAPATVTGVAAVPAPTVQNSSDGSAAPATVAGTAGIPTPSVQTSSGSTAAPATVVASAAVATPTIIATNSPTPGTVVTVAAVPGRTPATSITVTVTTVVAAAGIPTPSIGVVTSPPVSTVTATATIPAPTVRIFASVTVATIAATTTIGQIRHTVGQVVTSTQTAKVIGVTLPGRII